MKKNKKVNFYLSSTLSGAIATSLVVAPFIGINQVNSKEETDRNKMEFSGTGFSTETPSYTNATATTERPLVQQQFFRTTQPEFNEVFESQAQRENLRSKSFITFPNEFSVKYEAPQNTAGYGDGYRMVTAGQNEEVPGAKGLKSTDLSGSGEIFYNKQFKAGWMNAEGTIRENPVVSAHAGNDAIWLLTQGWYGANASNVGGEFVYALQVFRYTLNSSSNDPATITRSRVSVVIPFAEGSDRVNNPPVISPIYQVNANGTISFDQNEVIIWQQNVGYNDLDVIKYNILTGLQTRTNLGAITSNPKTMAITPVKNGANIQYFVHHTTNAGTGVSLSRFSNPGISSTPDETVVLDLAVNSADMDVSNEMPYAKIYRNATSSEMVWAFTKNNQSKIYASTLNGSVNSINNNGTSILNLGVKNRNIRKIEYTNIGSYTNNTNWLSLKLSNSAANPTATMVPVLLNLSEMKKDPYNPAILQDIVPLTPGNYTNLLPFFSIIGVTSTSITYGFHSNNIYVKQERKIEDPSQNFYGTVTPGTILRPISANNPQFTIDTPNAQLQTLINSSTKNLIGAAQIVDRIGYLEHNYFDVLYYMNGGVFDKGNLLVAADDWLTLYTPSQENDKFGTIPNVPEGRVPFARTRIFQGGTATDPLPIDVKLNAKFFSNERKKAVSANQFIQQMGEEIGVNLSVDYVYNPATDDAFISQKNTSAIQVNDFYIGSLRNVIIITDDKEAFIDIELTFSDGTTTTIIKIIHDGFVPVLGIDPVAIGIGVGVTAVVLAILLAVLLTLLKKRKKKDMTKALNAGFSLREKLGDQGKVDVLGEDKTKTMSVSTNQVKKPNQPNSNTQKIIGPQNPKGVQKSVSPQNPNGLTRPNQPNNVRRPMNQGSNQNPGQLKKPTESKK